MLNLEQIVFKADTTELQTASKQVAALGSEVQKLAKTMQGVSKESAQAAKLQAEANLLNAKAANEQAKASKNQSKANDETAESTKKVTKVIRDRISVEEKQRSTLDFMTQGYSKGQASVLAYAKSIGESTDAIGALLQAQRRLQGGDPFDKSLGSLQLFKNELLVLEKVQDLYNRNLGLSMSQMQNLGREHVRLTEQFKLQGKAMSGLEKEYEDVVQAAVKLTTAENKISSALSSSEAAANASGKAMSFLEREIQRVDNVVEGFNNNLGQSTSNRLTKFREQLRLSGMDAKTAAVMLSNYESKLRTIENTNQKKVQSNRANELNYLARATSVQLGDIGISLAGGQNPFTVLIQQGDQLRGVLNQVGADATEMKTALSSAFRQIVVGGYDVVKALGTFVIGSFVDTGKAALKLVTDITGLNKVLEYTRYQLTLFAMTDSSWGKGLLAAFNMVRLGAIAAATAVTFLAGTALIGLAVGLYQVIKEENALTKVLALNSGAFAMTTDTAISYAQELAKSTGTTAKFAEAIGEMAKQGNFVREEIGLVSTSAVEMAKYFDISISDTVKSFSKMKEEPVKALIELAKQTGLVTTETINSVQELQKQGKAAEASSLAIKALADVNSQQVERMKKDYNSFSLWLIETGAKISQFFANAFKDLFRSNGIDSMRRELASVEKQLERLTNDDGSANMFQGARVEALRALKQELIGKINLTELESAAQEEQIRINVEGAKVQAGLNDLMKDANKTIDQNIAKTMSLSDFTRKFIDEKVKAAAKEQGISASQLKLTADITKALEQQAKIEWESKQKKDKKNPEDNYYATTLKQVTDQLERVKGATESLTQVEILRNQVILDPKYQALSQSRKDEIKTILDQAAAIEKQTQVEQLREKIFGQTNMLGKEYYKTLDQINDLVKSGDLGAEDAKQLAKALSDATPLAKAMAEWHAKMQQAIAKSNEETKNALGQLAIENSDLDYRLSLFGKSESEQRKITIEYERQKQLAKALLDYEKKRNDILNDKDFGDDNARQVALNNALTVYEATLNNINKNAAVRYAEDMMAEFQRISDGITDSIVTALFEGGKAGSRKLRDLIVAELKKPVTLVVQAVVNTVLGSIVGGLLGGGGSGAGGISNMISMGMQGVGIWSGLTSGQGILGSIGSFLGLGGGSAVAGAITGAGATGLGLTAGAGGLGLSAGAGGLGMTVGAGGATAGAAGGAMAGVSGFLSAIPVWGWAAMGAAVIASLLGEESTPHSGAGSSYSAASGLSSIDLTRANGMGFMAEHDASTQTFTDRIVTAIGTGLTQTAAAFGNEAEYLVSAAYADDSSEDGAWGQLIISRDGVNTVNWGLEDDAGQWAPREYADGEEGLAQYQRDIAIDARDALKDAIGDVEWATDMLDALGDSPTLEQVVNTINEINAIKAAFDGLGQNITGFADLTNQAVSALVEASGGVNALLTNMQSFYDNYYSDEEKKANITRDIQTALADVGLEMPRTREEYRKMVEEQLALGEEGAEAAAILLRYSGAFASITDDGAAAAQAELDRQEELRRAIIEQQKDILNIQIRAIEEQINMFQKMFDFLDNEVKKLYGSVESTAKMQLAQARGVINSAVASRTLPEQGQLEDAVGTITGSFDNRNYSSKVEADRDRLKFAAQLDDLRSIAGNSLASAKNTFDLLKLQLSALEESAVMDKKQLEGLVTIDASVQELIDAVNNIGKDPAPTTPTGGGAGGTGPSGGSGAPLLAKVNPYQTRTEYGSEEALTSFEKFKAWYVGLRTTADPMMNPDYKVPDWLRISGFADDNSDEALFGEFLFYKNNPQYAKDFETIMTGGVSGENTDGSTIVKSDLSKMPEEVRKYFEGNTNTLLAYEGMGADPVLAYHVAKYGAESLGIDPKTTNIAEYLRTHKWTEAGIVTNNNPSTYANAGYSGYNLARYDNDMQVIVDVDGTLYTLDGTEVGTASREQMVNTYGEDYVNNMGGNYGSSTQSRLYNQHMRDGFTPEQYYANLRKYTDQMMTEGWSAQRIADAMKATGTSLADMGRAYGVTASEIADNLRNGGATSIPTFAKGGSYNGGLALVGEQGPELINFNQGGYVHTASQTSNLLSQSEVIECLYELNAKIEMVEAAVRSTAVSNNKMAKLLDRITPDGNAMQVKTVEGSVVTTTP